jgi:hypothetical protein
LLGAAVDGLGFGRAAFQPIVEVARGAGDDIQAERNTGQASPEANQVGRAAKATQEAAATTTAGGFLFARAALLHAAGERPYDLACLYALEDRAADARIALRFGLLVGGLLAPAAVLFGLLLLLLPLVGEEALALLSWRERNERWHPRRKLGGGRRLCSRALALGFRWRRRSFGLWHALRAWRLRRRGGWCGACLLGAYGAFDSIG